MTAWAAGKIALAICDNCGRTIKYRALKMNISAQRPTGLLVCGDCNDLDHPQLMLGRFRVDDPISLRNGRPDWPNTQGLAGYNPIVGTNIDFGGGLVFAAPSRDTATEEENIGFSIPGGWMYITVGAGPVEAGA